MVAELQGIPVFSRSGADGRQLILTVTVPDKSEKDDQFSFSVAGYQAATPAVVGP